MSLTPTSPSPSASPRQVVGQSASAQVVSLAEPLAKISDAVFLRSDDATTIGTAGTQERRAFLEKLVPTVVRPGAVHLVGKIAAREYPGQGWIAVGAGDPSAGLTGCIARDRAVDEDGKIVEAVETTTRGILSYCP